MTFTERLKIIENLIQEDPERCLLEISSKTFISSLFYPQLKALVTMFEGVLQKKTNQSKQVSERNFSIRPQIIIGLYSVIIMRSNVVSIKQECTSSIATKADSQNDSVFNLKLAVETLLKIYKTLVESDPTKEIICGLLLKIRGFNNYKLIAKDLNPLYISDQTMDVHFESLKTVCPNLLEIQLNKNKKRWSKYLRYKPISLINFQGLLTKLADSHEKNTSEEENELLHQLSEETAYLLNRFTLFEESEESEKIDIEQFTSAIDQIYIKLCQKIKETALTTKKSAKGEHIQLQYDLKQQKHRNYLTVLNDMLTIVNKSISSLHLNWLRKMKWLFNFIFILFINFDIKGNNFHEAVAIQYSKILVSLVQIVTNYLVTFKSGLFPQGKLNDLAFLEEYSVYKLLQACLYNQYPFEESEAVRYQNYQKQRRHHDNKSKQHVIDIVNFNMKSLNINIHWDSMLIKIIPQMKNSLFFAKQMVNLSLLFFHQYFEITHNYQEAPKMFLMISNARNTIFTTDKKASAMIKKIKDSVYPERSEIKEGIEYFCEQYFQEQLKYNKKRMQKMEAEQAVANINRQNILDLCKTDELQISSINEVNYNIKKTQSCDALIQGWQNYESIKESVKQNSNKENPMFQSIQSQNNENNEIFYSINESKHQKMMQAIKNQKVPQEELQEEKEEDNQILLPQF